MRIGDLLWAKFDEWDTTGPTIKSLFTKGSAYCIVGADCNDKILLSTDQPDIQITVDYSIIDTYFSRVQYFCASDLPHYPGYNCRHELTVTELEGLNVKPKPITITRNAT